MLVKEYESAGAYLEENEAELLKDEAASQLVYYSARENNAGTSDNKFMFGVIQDNDDVLLHFCNAYPENVSIYAGNYPKESLEQAAGLLAEYFIQHHTPVAGLNARYDICRIFIEHYKKGANVSFMEKLGNDIMVIRKVNEIKPADGFHRLAYPEEATLITDWMIRFQLESLANEINYETANACVKDLIYSNKFHVFENNEKEIVSMAAAARQLKNGVTINYIYTPEEYRGLGYAAANIYYMSKEILEQGFMFCTLFVDKKNPLSARAYEKVGYTILNDNYEYKIIV